MEITFNIDEPLLIEWKKVTRIVQTFFYEQVEPWTTILKFWDFYIEWFKDIHIPMELKNIISSSLFKNKEFLNKKEEIQELNKTILSKSNPY